MLLNTYSVMPTSWIMRSCYIGSSLFGICVKKKVFIRRMQAKAKSFAWDRSRSIQIQKQGYINLVI